MTIEEVDTIAKSCSLTLRSLEDYERVQRIDAQLKVMKRLLGAPDEDDVDKQLEKSSK